MENFKTNYKCCLFGGERVAFSELIFARKFRSKRRDTEFGTKQNLHTTRNEEEKKNAHTYTEVEGKTNKKSKSSKIRRRRLRQFVVFIMQIDASQRIFDVDADN